jgi:general stress protein CsbA
MEDWKIKIAVLWSLFEFCMIAVSIVGQSMPGFMPETPEMRLVLAVSLLIPPIMAFLSLILKDSVNRWVNIILSIILIAMAYPFGLAEATADYFGAIATITIVEVIALALIIWYAWKSKQKT